MWMTRRRRTRTGISLMTSRDVRIQMLAIIAFVVIEAAVIALVVITRLRGG
jgi:hypothetical protein